MAPIHAMFHQLEDVLGLQRKPSSEDVGDMKESANGLRQPAFKHEMGIFSAETSSEFPHAGIIPRGFLFPHAEGMEA